jgi:hypothetical protein
LMVRFQLFNPGDQKTKDGQVTPSLELVFQFGLGVQDYS